MNNNNFEVISLSELEIGNWVSLKLKNTQSLNLAYVKNVDTFGMSDFQMIDMNSEYIEKIVGVPLTCEWLQYFGFRPFPTYNNFLCLRIGDGNGIVVEIDKNENIVKTHIIENGNERIHNCKYVHKLQQNISFLTIIKETSI